MVVILVQTDNYVQAPDFTQSFNRYGYVWNNPLKNTDPDGEWLYIVIGAVVSGVVNLVINWDNCDGFWQYAVTMGTNSVIAQTGHNFSGMGNVDWGQVGVSSAIGAVSGFAGGATGYWAANSSMLVNGISSPVLRSAVVSPLAAGAGHIAGGTTAGLIKGQSLKEAFASSFNGLGQSMAFGAAIGVATTVGVSYAQGISPWTGKYLTPRNTIKSLDLNKTMDRINNGEGSTFQNREGILPNQPAGYYKEYVHPTIGVNGPGPQRIIIGLNGDIYYTPDHYKTFIQVHK